MKGHGLMSRLPRPVRAGLFIVLMVALGAIYWQAAARHSREVNTDRESTDQGAYLNAARKMRETGHAHVGDRNRMPIYPFLQSWQIRPGLSEDAIFERGKRLNIVLSLALLAGIGAILMRSFGPLTSLNLLLVMAFTVFVFKAAYVQCELLYYTLSFCGFLLMCSCLREPEWRKGLLAGAVLGLAHLTKAAILPALALYLAIGALSGLAAWLMASRRRREAREPGRTTAPWRPILAAAMTALGFLVVVYPYISTSKRVFGRYFYNVNSTFYMWYDTHEQVMTGTRVHGDREGWPEMPADQIPSLRRYLREHTSGQIVRRVTDGLAALHDNAARSFGFYKYVLMYAGLALVVTLWDPAGAAALLRSHRAPVAFAVCLFAGYAVLYAWISATNSGMTRLTLQQFTPLMYGLSWVAFSDKLRPPAMRLGGRTVKLTDAFNVVVLVMISLEIPLVVTSRVVAIYGGS